jgi:hypothetical protein
MGASDPALRALLRDVLDRLLRSETWAWLLPLSALGLLFATALVRRRSPGPLPLLALGGALGLICTRLTGPVRELGLFARLVSESALAFWVMLAVPVVLAAVLQPGGPAPVRPARAARHLLPAVGGGLLLALVDPETSCLGIPIVLVALGALREGEGTARAWRTANTLLACHASAVLGLTLGQALLDENDPFLLAFEGWVAAQALWGLAELRHGSLRAWAGAFVLLLGLGAAVSVARYPLQAQILWHSLGRTLPRCTAGEGRPPGEDAWVGTQQALPPWLSGLPLWPDVVLVLDRDEPLGVALAGTPGRGIWLACRGIGRRRYQTMALPWGAGVELRRVGGALVLADGEPPTWTTIEQASQRCGSPSQVALGQGDWPASVVIDLCERKWPCAYGSLCTWTEAAGWHLSSPPEPNP